MSSDGNSHNKPEEKPISVHPISVVARTSQLPATPPMAQWTSSGDRPRQQPHLFSSGQTTAVDSTTSISNVVSAASTSAVVTPSTGAFPNTTPAPNSAPTTSQQRIPSSNTVTQAIAAGLMNQSQVPFGPQPPTTASPATSAITSSSNPSATNPTSQQFQKLKVEDALSYLDQVKYQFGNQPQVYNDFLDIMKEFKSQSIDTPGVIQRVSHLFNGHPDLIVGFNTFLPPGYKIEVSGNDQISVTGPNMVSQNITQIGLKSLPINQTFQVQTPNGVKILAPPTNVVPHISSQAPLSSTATAAPTAAGATTTLSSGPVSFSRTTTSTIGSNMTSSSVVTSSASITSSAPISGNLPASNMKPAIPRQPVTASSSSANEQAATSSASVTSSATSSAGATSGGTAAQQPPVEFNHAINYVNKIKNRFHGQPDIYKAFLDILHKYQKEQRNVKETNGSYTPTLSESEVYQQVALLFKYDRDLLSEFGQFLPDANGNFGGSFGASGSTNTPQNSIPTSSVASSKPTPQQSINVPTVTQVKTEPMTAGGPQSTVQKKSYHHQHGGAGKSPTQQPTATIMSTRDDHTSNNNNATPYKVHKPVSVSLQQSGQATKRPASSSFSGAHIPNPKKVRSCSVRDVTLAEASKLGTLQEFAYFDKVRKALRCPEAYDSFLRCLLLYNNEIISKHELAQLVHVYLSKWKDLLMWFKSFLGLKADLSVVGEDLPTPPRLQQQLKDKHEGMAMEIDYSSLQRLGFSYRALPSSYQQPKCSGRDELCKKVLNDRWVSFPTFSEDSTFVNSKKNAFEEHIYRCEDERYEMDVVLEINLAALKFLEFINRKLRNMSHDELARFKFDQLFAHGNNHDEGKAAPEISETTLRKALKRIYGEHGKEIYSRMRQDPKNTIPYVLKRLRSKDEEWRHHHRQFQKQWRLQSEKYYLKSLDHQSPHFKTHDVKYIRPKQLVNELESLYDERLEAIENNSDVNPVTGPHIRVTYEDKSMIDDAASLIIHHVKRQQTINSEDKEKIRHIVYKFLPDLYFAPRGTQPSDDDDDDEDEDDSDDGGKRNKNNGAVFNGDNFPGYSPTDNMEGHYHLFMGNNTFYIFFRLHYLLCDRLLHMSRVSEKLLAERKEESKSRKNNEEAMAELLCLAPRRNSKSDEDLYACFMDYTRQLLDGNLEPSTFEDKMRDKFTIHGYVTFTIDKLIGNIVRQLQNIVTEDACIALLELYKSEESNQATGGTFSSQHKRQQNELQYQRKSESLTSSQNCMKINIFQHQNELIVGIELIDTEGNDNPDLAEYSKWNEYLEQYANADENDLSDEVREKLEEKLVFMQRNANGLKTMARNASDNDEDTECFIYEGIESSFKPNSYKISYVPGTFDIICRKGRITSATAQSRQRPIAERLRKKMVDWHEKWAHENISRDMAKQTNNWLMGRNTPSGSPQTQMHCNQDLILSRNVYTVEKPSSK